MKLVSFLFLSLFCAPAWADLAVPVSQSKIDGCVKVFSMVAAVPLILCVSVVLCSIILFVVFAQKDIPNNKKKKLFFILPSILLIIFLINLIPGHPCKNNMECKIEYMKNRFNLENWCESKLFVINNIRSVCPECNFLSRFDNNDRDACDACLREYHQSWEYTVFKNIPIKCPADKPLMSVDGRCYSCDDNRAIGSENCKVCSNRIITKNGMCVLKCPADKPLKDNRGNCHSCDEKGWINTENCEVCSNRIVDKSGRCVLKCPADKPLRGKYGDCHSCDSRGGDRNRKL